MDRNTKLTALISLLLASAFFLSFTVFEQRQRDERLLKLSDDDWCKQSLAEAFPDFPVIVRLDKIANTAEKLKEHREPNMAQYVVEESGQYPMYYRLFMIFQREPDPVQWDQTNHYHFGFITSDLEVYDLGLNIVFD